MVPYLTRNGKERDRIDQQTKGGRCGTRDDEAPKGRSRTIYKKEDLIELGFNLKGTRERLLSWIAQKGILFVFLWR